MRVSLASMEDNAVMKQTDTSALVCLATKGQYVRRVSYFGYSVTE